MIDVAPLLFGISGAASGFALPHFTQRLVEYKSKKKGISAPRSRWHTALWLRLVCSLGSIPVWVAASLSVHPTLAALLLSLLFSASVVTAWVDLRIRLIPNEMILFLLLAGVVFRWSMGGLPSLLASLGCLVAMIFVFSIVAHFTGFGMVGAGDVKLAGVMGLILGYPGILSGLLVLCMVFLLFTAIGLLTKRITLRTMVPLAPFLMAGQMAALLGIVWNGGNLFFR